ncbi:ubiquitin-protein ligase peroxin 12 [Cystobasidiomycetes sp. EMM_F5]
MNFLSDVSAGGNDRYAPSFFELAAQEQLRDLLQPVVRYLLSVGFQAFIRKVAILMLRGSFAENFYGMKRRRRPAMASERAQDAAGLFTDHTRLRKRELRWSLFFLVAVPYLRSKAEDLYDQLGGSTGADLFNDSVSSRDAMQDDQATALIHTQAAHCTSHEKRKVAAAQESLRQSPFRQDPDTGQRPAVMRVLARAMLLGPQYLLEALKVFLPTSIFFFKFLEWWYSSSYARSGTASSQADAAAPPLKPPQTRLSPHPDGVVGIHGPLAKGHCPVCRKATTNPAAVPTGWVGDYRCLYDYVEREGVCPVTLIPVALGDLRKIMG